MYVAQGSKHTGDWYKKRLCIHLVKVKGVTGELYLIELGKNGLVGFLNLLYSI